MKMNTYKMFLILFFILIIAYVALAQDINTTQIPKENIEEGTIPSLENANSTANLIINAITLNDMTVAKEAFFPEAAFLSLKDMTGSELYYKKLIKWYLEDVQRERKKLEGKINLKLKKFLPGRCRWMKVGREYNKIAYWSCSRNKFIVTDEKNDYTIELRVMINWGTAWYVTHLGPIPKE